MQGHLSVRSLVKTYAIGITWFVVMLASAMVLMAAVSGQFASSSLSISQAALFTAVVTVALASVVATAVTGGALVVLRQLEATRKQGDLSRG